MVNYPNGSIEHVIQQALAELGIANPVLRGHTFLLRDRQLVGRRFCFDGVEAVWQTDVRQLKLYDERGECLRVVDMGDEEGRMAA